MVAGSNPAMKIWKPVRNTGSWSSVVALTYNIHNFDLEIFKHSVQRESEMRVVQVISAAPENCGGQNSPTKRVSAVIEAMKND